MRSRFVAMSTVNATITFHKSQPFEMKIVFRFVLCGNTERLAIAENNAVLSSPSKSLPAWPPIYTGVRVTAASTTRTGCLMRLKR